MFFRLIRDFSRDSQAGIAIMTVFLFPFLVSFFLIAIDMGIYYSTDRLVASTAQQTVEWMANRGLSSGEDANTLTKQALDKRLGKNILSSASKSLGITSTMTNFSYDSTTGINTLVVTADYNMLTRKIFSLTSVPLKAIACVKLHPVFASIVFSSGEMRSEGDYIYGNQQTSTLSPNRGVSWSNTYYTDVIGNTVATRTTPTHNYYVVAALAKQLAQRFQYRQLFINIIPVSATINLNPLDSSSTPKGSREGKLPPWIFADTGFQLDNTSNADPAKAYCITNRSFPGGKAQGSFYAKSRNLS